MTTLSDYIGSVPTERKAPLWKRLVFWAFAHDRLARERGYLDRLDAHLLRDMGLTRTDVDQILANPEAHLRSILLRGPH